MQLIVTEIFKSIQGESTWAGKPCSFVRLTGCPLRCRWCDSVYTFKGGEPLSIAAILEKLAAFGLPLVEVTGGEPLAQENCIPLLKALHAAGYTVLLETSGAIFLEQVPAATHIIMDIKCPESGMAAHHKWENLSYLKATDEVKFVIASREDFDWCTEQIRCHSLAERFTVLLSPAWGIVPPRDLVAWMLEKNLNCRLNLQQHKYIWSPRARGV